MNVYLKILIFFLIWLAFGTLYSIMVYIFFPVAFTASAAELKLLLSTNYLFLLSNQLALLLATFSTIYFFSKVIDKSRPDFLRSMMNLKGILNGILFGAFLISACILVLTVSDHIEIVYQGFQLEMLYYVFIFLIVAISEEAMVRGFILHNLYIRTNKSMAIIISSLIFSLMHIFNSSIDLISVINLFLVGVLFALLYLKNMNLSIPIGLHFSWNFLQGPVFGFSVSGISTPGIFKVQNISGTQFSFEGFGLEGSIILTAIFSIIISFFILTYFITPWLQPGIDKGSSATHPRTTHPGLPGI